MPPKRPNYDADYVKEESGDDDYTPRTRSKKIRTGRGDTPARGGQNQKKAPATEVSKFVTKIRFKQAKVVAEAATQEDEDLTGLDATELDHEMQLFQVHDLTESGNQLPHSTAAVGKKHTKEVDLTDDNGDEAATAITVDEVETTSLETEEVAEAQQVTPNKKDKKPKASRKKNVDNGLEIVGRPPPMPSLGRFPRYGQKSRVVYIELLAGHEKYTYRLDMGKLKEGSVWFTQALDGNAKGSQKESDPKVATKWTSDFGPSHVFDLEYEPERQLWYLRKITRSISQPIKHQDNADLLTIENNEETPTVGVIDEPGQGTAIIAQDESNPKVSRGLTPPPSEQDRVNAEQSVPTLKNAGPDNHPVSKISSKINENEMLTDHESVVEEVRGAERLSTAKEISLTDGPSSVSTACQNQTSPSAQHAPFDEEPGLPTDLELPVKDNSTEHLATPPRLIGDGSNLVNEPNTEFETDAGLESVKESPLPPKEKLLTMVHVEESQTSTHMNPMEVNDVEMVAAQKHYTKLDKSHTAANQEEFAQELVPSEKTLEGYDNLFRIYCGIEPRISSYLDVATDQIEFIFNLSTLYGLPVTRIVEIRQSFSKYLRRFKKDLWKAIMEDPARWLYISMFLRSPSIFREAIIHIVGSHSHDPWEHSYEEYIQTNVSILIHEKIEELIIAKECADAALLRCTIMVDGTDVREVRRGTGYDAYNCWHDWYRDQMADALEARQNGDNIDGMRFQLIAGGRDVYLEANSTVDKYKSTLASNGMELTADEEKSFLLHLSTMKEQATSIALPMVISNSNLDNLKHQISHLTCTDVVHGEFAWQMDKMDPYFGP
ncbi:hypothetical protein GLAREA_01775 [Glarea lozoyensis ATCC 20868]|uniref:Uncharacterized protein n=1 Tax=Glarea lozoyensis (strain ATCC 20868 / MF5171) TaxID=1116229 RepID=S3DH13_GLAL2|nr:uncharacterized protein GLAREA_01775 [Glarea lozoyensis ATCC 20868]EPE25863.1 hypothetical protein GLAREA_01775 [Glarea lozoyensis ATCC 20868]